jgi:hypothetical protein
VNFQEMLRDSGADTQHVCTADSCPSPSSYYVSAVDDAGQGYYLMAGPYATHSAALADVGLAQLIASRYGSDGSKGAWMRWGTLRYPDGNAEPGRLNKHGLFERYAAEQLEQQSKPKRRKIAESRHTVKHLKTSMI